MAALDAADAVWMFSLGDWMDNTSRITAVLTLGGNHYLEMGCAVAAFVLLAGAAVPTGGFAELNRLQAGLVAVASVLSIVALVGVLSVFALTVGVALLLALLGRAFVRGHR